MARFIKKSQTLAQRRAMFARINAAQNRSIAKLRQTQRDAIIKRLENKKESKKLFKRRTVYTRLTPKQREKLFDRAYNAKTGRLSRRAEEKLVRAEYAIVTRAAKTKGQAKQFRKRLAKNLRKNGNDTRPYKVIEAFQNSLPWYRRK